MENSAQLINIVGLRLLRIKLVFNLLKGADASDPPFKKVHFEEIKPFEEDERLWGKATLEQTGIKQDERIPEEKIVQMIDDLSREARIGAESLKEKSSSILRRGISYVTFNGGGWWELGNFLSRLPQNHELRARLQRKFLSLPDQYGYDITVYLRQDITADRMKITDRWVNMDPDLQNKEKLDIYLKRMCALYDEKAPRMGSKCVTINFPQDDGYMIFEVKSQLQEILKKRGLT